MVSQLLQWQSNEGHTVYLCCSKDNPLREIFAQTPNVKLLQATPDSKHFRIKLALEVAQVKGFDIFHGHCTPAVRTCALLAMLFRKVGVGHGHNFKSSNAFKWVAKVGGIIAVSESVKSFYEKDFGISPDCCPVIYNAVEPELGETSQDPFTEIDKEFGMNPNNVRIVFGGTLGGIKNIPRLIDSIPPNANLYLCGPVLDDEVHRSRQQCIDSGTKNIAFLGARDDLFNIISHSQLGILASTEEPFGIFVIECLALGTPCIVSDLDGPGEIMQIVKKGLVGISQPTISEEIQRAIFTAISDKERLKLEALEASELVRERFSAELMNREVLKFYHCLLSKPRR